MTTSPSEPVDNAILPDVSELSSGDGMPGADELPADSKHTDGGGVDDQDSAPTSTAPAENNPTVPDPPD